MQEVGKIVKDIDGIFWIVRDDSENEGVIQDMVGADINHELKFLDFIRRISADFEVFVDIGAHVGYYSVRLSKYFTELYAFEPSFYNRKGFYANININGIENINVMFNAIGGSDEEIDFLERGSVSCVKPMTEEYTISEDTIKATNKVKMVTLGTVFPKGIDIPVIMKIDTEGSELGAIRGGENLFLGTKMILLVEHHDSKISGNKDKIINYLKKLGYTINYEDQSKLVATNMKQYEGLRV